MKCAVCSEREASKRYYRINSLTEEVENLCRSCWLEVRRSGRDEWSYFVGVSRFLFLFSVLPLLLLGVAIGLLMAWVL